MTNKSARKQGIAMRIILYCGFGGAALCALAGTAAAEETASQTRAVDARVVRVKLDGIIDLTLRQGPVALLVISGDQRYLARTSTTMNGDTLTIDTESDGITLRPQARLRAELILPRLRQVTSDGVGRAEIAGFSGDALDVSLDGAGSMNVVCDYRIVNASLGGLGSMLIKGVFSDGIDLKLQGAGYVTLSGRGKWLKADMGGLGSLHAQDFDVDKVSLALSGLGNAAVTARHSATVNVSGLGSVAVYGKPVSRSVSVDGLGHVSWK